MFLHTPSAPYVWQEELYRRAVVANSTGQHYSHYDEELLAEWRKLYNQENAEWARFEYWNPFVDTDPRQLDYWLDFIDEDAAVGKFSIKNIGRRSKVLTASDVTAVYNTILETPILFKYLEEGYSIPSNFDASGYTEFQIPKQYTDMFIPSTTGVSAYEKIRELLY